MARTNRKGKKNGSREKTKIGYTYRAYCPVCFVANHPDPQTNPSVPAQKGTHLGTCRNGHKFSIDIGSYTGLYV